MVRLGMGTGQVPTALDLEEGLRLIGEVASDRGAGGARARPGPRP
jgi:hypothetical protein